IQGYLLADTSPDELSAGVQAVSRGMHHLSPPVAARLADSHSRERLSAREEEVLRLVIAGLCNKDICRRMKIALGTVKSHLKSAFAKMKVESRTGAIAEARRSGLLPLDEPELLRQSDTRVAEQSPRPAV